MSNYNPIAGQSYGVALVTTEPLSGATVTIEYKNDNGQEVTGIAPSHIDTSTGTITWNMTPELTQMGGTWEIKAKIVKSGLTYYNVNDVSVTFDPKFR